MDYIYGKLCQQVKEVEYTGDTTETIRVNVDNDTRVITADYLGKQPDVTKEYVDEQDEALSVGIAAAQHTADNSLPLAGGTMSGDINMDNNAIINLSDPIEESAAANKAYVDDTGLAAKEYTDTAANALSQRIDELPSCLPIAGGTMEGNIDMDGSKITNLPRPVNSGDAATKEYIDGAISEITSFEYRVVEELPLVGEKGVIYFVPHSHETRDIYDEYIWITNAYEKIGNTDVDLRDYLKKDGSVKMTGNLDTNNNAIINLSNPEKEYTETYSFSGYTGGYYYLTLSKSADIGSVSVKSDYPTDVVKVLGQAGNRVSVHSQAETDEDISFEVKYHSTDGVNYKQVEYPVELKYDFETGYVVPITISLPSDFYFSQIYSYMLVDIDQNYLYYEDLVNSITIDEQNKTMIIGEYMMEEANFTIVFSYYEPVTYAVNNEEVEKITDDLRVNISQIDEKFGKYLPLSGGTMTGDISMDGNAVTGLPAPSADTDAVPKEYVDDIARDLYDETQRIEERVDDLPDCLPLSGGTMTGNINFANMGDGVRLTNSQSYPNNGEIYGIDSNHIGSSSHFVAKTRAAKYQNPDLGILARGVNFEQDNTANRGWDMYNRNKKTVSKLGIDNNDQRLINVAAPEDDSDAANKGYVDSAEAAANSYTDEAKTEIKQYVEDTVNSGIFTNSASGAMASFSDGADNVPVESLTVDINPVQGGSGIPSPDNVRNISGRTNCTIIQCAKNLLDSNSLKTYSNWRTDISTSGAAATTTVNPGYVLPTVPGTTYTIHFTLNRSDLPLYLYLCKAASGVSEVVQYLTTDVFVTDQYNFTAEDGYTYFLRLYTNNNESTFDEQMSKILRPTLVLGNTVESLDSYEGNTYSVNWEESVGTIYYGTLDVTTGLLTSDGTTQIFDDRIVGFTNWNVDKETDHVRVYANKTQFAATYPTPATAPKDVYDCCATVGNVNQVSVPWTASITAAGNVQAEISLPINIFDGVTTATEAAKAARNYLHDHPIRVSYKTTNPITYQLKPIQINTLLGCNNIFADTGNTSVTYIADTKLYIDNKFAELQALVLENISNT